ncbi:MAG: DUF2510 domain-containing protein [Coriobacteriia bacterium]|nr:DUF2510 domain-containing protein [Coriobacteriia bacterium]
MADQKAGWYPDPTGDAAKLRYWDGAQWTNEFADNPGFVQAADQTAQVAGAAVQDAQPATVVEQAADAVEAVAAGIEEAAPVATQFEQQPVTPVQPPVAPVQQPVQPLQPAQPHAVVADTSYYNTTGGQPGAYPSYAPPAAKQSNGLAIAALICGIVGLCPFTFGLPAIAAIILGIIARKNPVQKGLATVGMVLGIVALVIGISVLVLGIVAASMNL